MDLSKKVFNRLDLVRPCAFTFEQELTDEMPFYRKHLKGGEQILADQLAEHTYLCIAANRTPDRNDATSIVLTLLGSNGEEEGMLLGWVGHVLSRLVEKLNKSPNRDSILDNHFRLRVRVFVNHIRQKKETKDLMRK